MQELGTVNDQLDCKQKEIETLRTEVEELREKLDETFEKLSATEQSARSAEAEAVKFGSRAEAAEQTVAETRVIHARQKEEIRKLQQELDTMRDEVVKPLLNTSQNQSPNLMETVGRRRTECERHPSHGAVTVDRDVCDNQVQKEAIDVSDQAKLQEDVRWVHNSQRLEELELRVEELQVREAELAEKRRSEEEKHAAKLASMTAQHEHYLREQSRIAVESASAAAAQAAAQFDATISERERAVAAAEAQIQMRRDEIEREGTRMTEMLRCAENDSATAAKQLKSLEERLTAMEKAEASILSRRLELDDTKMEIHAHSGEIGPRAVTNSPLAHDSRQSSLPSSPKKRKRHKTDDASQLGDDEARQQQLKSGMEYHHKKRKSLGAHVISALRFAAGMPLEDEDEQMNRNFIEEANVTVTPSVDDCADARDLRQLSSRGKRTQKASLLAAERSNLPSSREAKAERKQASKSASRKKELAKVSRSFDQKISRKKSNGETAMANKPTAEKNDAAPKRATRGTAELITSPAKSPTRRALVKTEEPRRNSRTVSTEKRSGSRATAHDVVPTLRRSTRRTRAYRD